MQQFGNKFFEKPNREIFLPVYFEKKTPTEIKPCFLTCLCRRSWDASVHSVFCRSWNGAFAGAETPRRSPESSVASEVEGPNVGSLGSSDLLLPLSSFSKQRITIGELLCEIWAGEAADVDDATSDATSTCPKIPFICPSK